MSDTPRSTPSDTTPEDGLAEDARLTADHVPTPDAEPELMVEGARSLIIACGALAREIMDVIRLNGWTHLSVTCLPAKWHNTPQFIPDGVREKIRANRGKFDHFYVAYADCGTGGLLDRVIEEEGAERVAGPHCYAFYTGLDAFDEMAEAEIGTFYLTDYLARHFDTLIVKGMKLDRHPGMRDMLFGNYTRLVYLAQVDDPELDRKAEAAADRLGLRYEKRRTGYGMLADFIADAAARRN